MLKKFKIFTGVSLRSLAFEQAVSLYPHYYDALYNLRDTYAELGNKVGQAECARLMAQLRSKGNYLDA